MRWPWQQVETRSVDYSDSLVQFLLNRAQGNLSTADANATAALEGCAGAVGRAFAAADIESESPTVRAALNPDLLEMFGRQLIRTGEMVCYLDTTGGDLAIIPAQSHNVLGTPSTWRYDLTLGGPSVTQSYRDISAERVLHLRYAAHPSTPWRGQSPLEVAALAGRLAASTVKALADESGGPLANLIGLPLDGDHPSIAPFKKAIGEARGRVATIENGDWNASNGAFVDLVPKRLGPTPPDSLVDLMKLATNEIYAAVGINPAMMTAGDAASLRESWRLFLFGVVAPLGRKVEAELNRKLGDSIEMEWQELRASDIQGRSRSLAGLVKAGFTPESAAAETGFHNLVAAPTPPPMPEVNNVQN